VKNLLIVIAVLFAVGSVALAAGPVATVQMRPSATVPGPSVTVAEIAEVQSADPKFSARLSSVRVAQAPIPGSVRQLDATWVRTQLQQAGIDCSQINWSGSAKSTVALSTRQVPGEAIAEAAARWLTAYLAAQGGEPVVSLARAPSACSLPARVERIALTPRPLGNPGQGGKAQVSVEIRGAGRLWRKVPVTFDVALFKTVAVARERIAAGEPVHRSMLSLERMDVARLVGTPAESLEALDGQVTRRTVARGAILCTDVLRTPPTVRRGALVAMQLRRGAMLIRAKGVAKQDGRRGEIIKLVNVDSRREVLARVIDASTVEAVY